ncbi:MAG: GNAT family N-acetyltransferase [Thaumarchaeota archaeon]|nr:GNAT family N-acetyltransferase [Nitrososphaerota archaeon]
MSSAGNSTLIPRLEEIGNSFTGLWASSETLKCGTLFFNPDLSNDIFFDKLTNITCIDNKMLDDALALFAKRNTTPYVYTLNYPELEEILLKKNFRLYDVQHVLAKVPDSSRTPKVRMISSDESMIWSKTFCNAYGCHDWLKSVDGIVKKSTSSVGYFVDDSISSCVALYEKNSILGLYCLGTVPCMRKKGLAALLIDFALSEVKRRNLELLMLETYQKDALLDFYSKLGFKEIYQKNIYTI